jgi:serine/threonine protein kinase
MNTALDQQIDYNDIDFDKAETIGEGASCTVYKTSVFGMTCAVKVLATGVTGWEEQQFDAEVALLSSVQHPNLCSFYACSVNGPRKCLVLELMDDALSNRLFSQPPPGWEQRVWVALCVCRALSYLHLLSPPVIHRDVKSQVRERERERALAAFIIAR